jgi:hypothetical protein
MISENLINQSYTIFYVLDIILWFTQNEKNNTILCTHNVRYHVPYHTVYCRPIRDIISLH